MHEGGSDLEHQVSQLGVVLAGRHTFPQRRELLGPVGRHPLTLFGQPVHPAAVLLLGSDQSLVLELLQRRVHRTRARLPRAAAALTDLLDDLVPVHRLFGQQRDHRGADIATAGARPPVRPRALLPGITAAGRTPVPTARALPRSALLSPGTAETTLRKGLSEPSRQIPVGSAVTGI